MIVRDVARIACSIGGLIPYGFSEIDGDTLSESIHRINSVIEDYKHHSLEFDPVEDASDEVPLVPNNLTYELATCVAYRMATARSISLTTELIRQVRVSANKLTTGMSVKVNKSNERYFSYRGSGLATPGSISVKPVLDKVVAEAEQAAKDAEEAEDE